MPIRITGPYRHRGKWRCRVFEGPGVSRWATAADTPELARELAEHFAAGLEARLGTTVGGLLERYLVALADKGRRGPTVTAARVHLRKILEPLADLLPGSITPARARERYQQLTSECAVQTHHVCLGRARSMWAWALKQGAVKANPWLDVEPVGRPVRGKAQLRLDEIRRLEAVCQEHLDDGAIGVLLMMMLGLRVSEVMLRDVRDLDDKKTRLVIAHGKNESSKRVVPLPDGVREALQLLAVGRGPDEPLLVTSTGRRISRQWLRRETERYCELAGVPVVCPHGLRGSLASNLVRVGVSLDVVAQLLGHSSTKVTATHYAQAGALQQADSDRRMEDLRGRRDK